MINLNHDADHTFQKGDLVKVVREINTGNWTDNGKKFSWDTPWTIWMTEMIGKTATIERISPFTEYVVSSRSIKINGWWYPSSALEKVKV